MHGHPPGWGCDRERHPPIGRVTVSRGRRIVNIPGRDCSGLGRNAKNGPGSSGCAQLQQWITTADILIMCRPARTYAAHSLDLCPASSLPSRRCRSPTRQPTATGDLEEGHGQTVRSSYVEGQARRLIRYTLATLERLLSA